MSETSSSSCQVALLILVTGLFAAAWSSDSGFNDAEAADSPSGIAILMQTTGVESPESSVFDAEEQAGESVGWPAIVPTRLSFATCCTGATDCEADDCEADDRDTQLIVDKPVDAPSPAGDNCWSVARCGIETFDEEMYPSRPATTFHEPCFPCDLSLAADDEPVEAPIPVVVELPVEAPIPVDDDDGPVIAPVPNAAEPLLVNRESELQVLSVAARRVKMEYRMSCECCREYCGTASRQVAAMKREMLQSLNDLAGRVATAVNGIDWKRRLSSESPQRY